MGLVIPIGIAKALFQWITFWEAFKALKVPKTRRKIPRVAFRRDESTSLAAPRTRSSLDPLTSAQKLRRTHIKAVTKMCLVWAVWTRLLLIMDRVSWAIPFYEEIHLSILIWMILMGSASADFVFKHGIKRLASPYERTFDAILGTIHDILLVTMFIVTSGPKYLNKKYETWKARQFNKSLMSARATAPPTRLPSLQSLHFQPRRSSATSAVNPSPLEYSQRTEHATTLCDTSHSDSQSHYLSVAPTYPQRGISQQSSTIKVPQRKPTSSRKLSSTYRRSVSNSSLKSALDHRASFNLPKKSQVRVLENRFEPKPLATAHLNILREPKPMIFGSSNLIDLPPIRQAIVSGHAHVGGNQSAVFVESHRETSRASESDEDQNDSMIINDDCSEPADPTLDSAFSAHQSVLQQSRKRLQRSDEEQKCLAGAVRNGVPFRHDGSAQIMRSTLPPPRIQVDSPAGRASDFSDDHQATQDPPNKRRKVASISSDDPSPSSLSDDACDLMMAELSPSHKALTSDTRDEFEKTDTSIWRSAPNAALPMPDETISPTKVPPPTTRRRLHDADEPLPTYRDDQMREKVLGSIRGLTGDWDLPTSNGNPQAGKLNHRLTGLRQVISNSNTSPRERTPGIQLVRKKSQSQGKKTARVSNGKPNPTARKVSTFTKPRPISGKLGQERALKMLDKSKSLKPLGVDRKASSGQVLDDSSGLRPAKSNSANAGVSRTRPGSGVVRV